MKRIIIVIFAALVFCLTGSSVRAEQTSRPVVALGEDLTNEQRKAVLESMGLTNEDLKNCIVVTITNEMEHEYLGKYLDPSIIGERSLSSVMLTKAEPGNGVIVTTKNITYCTTGMYRNALLTAGVKDTNVLVVAPSPISGTAALIGALKAYEEMTGVEISREVMDTALNELIVTGDLDIENVDQGTVEELFAFVKGKLAAGELDTREEIEQAIAEAEAKFQISLTPQQKEKIMEVMEKINSLGLDPQILLEQAQDLYEKWANELIGDTTQVIEKTITESINDYFSEMWISVTDFFKGFFS